MGVCEPQAFDASLTFAVVSSQLSKWEDTTGLDMLEYDNQGKPQALTLTGWTAVLGVAASVFVTVGGAYYGYQRYRDGPYRGYHTVVLKGRKK